MQGPCMSCPSQMYSPTVHFTRWLISIQGSQSFGGWMLMWNFFASVLGDAGWNIMPQVEVGALDRAEII